MIFVCTCTVSFTLLLRNHFIYFVFTPHPNWRELLIFHFSDFRDNIYLIQKIGHFSGFFILALILSNFGRYKPGIYVSISYGIFTEILQLFFLRDGRIADMFIDSFGILLAYGLCRLFHSVRRHLLLQPK
ncbi:VanZ family protein [Paenibacillus sp. sptzw28]|uniref:VanZ family protein n=1 Tax=Paenibacillus sp. sptzw28 TaxID=715179 RepID=UPI0037CCAA44